MRTIAHPARRLLVLLLLLVLVASGLLISSSIAQNSDPILVGAGDIATCSRINDEATAALLDTTPGTVFTTGDNVYADGTPEQFIECYEPTWGRHKARTRPSPGNHDYHTPGAAGYFWYFQEAAGDPDKGYYAYSLGAWHIIVINSNCDEIGGCDVGSPQEQWLRAELAAHPTTCTLAYWHHPLFSSGRHGGDSDVQPIWQALYEAGADVVISGHDHNYERFAPQDPEGNADPEQGIRQFVVGTGGANLRPIEEVAANSEVRNAEAHGVLRLTLHPTSYDWQFLPVAGQTFTDSGSAACVGEEVPTPTLEPTLTPTGSPTSEPTLTPTLEPTPTPTAPPPTNLLLNPSFELDENADNRPDGWIATNRFVRSDAVPAHEGSFVGRATAPTVRDTIIRQTVAITPGASYQFSGWVRVPRQPNRMFSVRLQIRWKNALNETITTTTIARWAGDTNDRWAQGASQVVAPTDAVQAEVRIVSRGFRGSIFVDDFVLQSP